MTVQTILNEKRRSLFARRALLRGSVLGGAGLAAAALLGCGGDEGDDDATTDVDGGADRAATLSSTGDRPDTLPAGWVWEQGVPFPYQFPDPAGQPKAGGVVKIISTFDVSIFDPTKSPAGGTVRATNMVYNRLLGFETGPQLAPFNTTPRPELAATWERTPDGLTYTFKLVPGIKFQNVAPLSGRDFTAADVKFAYDAYRSGGQGQSYFVNVKSVDAIDATTLKITMNRAVADFVNNLAGRYLTVFPHETVDDGTIGQKVIGTGPMILKEAITGSHLAYEKNPNYFRKQVWLDGVEQRIIPDPAARLAAFRAGQMDADYNIVTGPAEARALLDTNPDIQLNMTPIAAGGMTVGMNLQLPKFQDARVRRAIALSIDRPNLVQLVHQTLGKGLPVTPWNYVFDQEPTGAELGKYWKYDPAEAKALLAAAGATGLEIDSVYYPYSARDTQTAEVLTDTMRQGGITLKSRPVDYTTFVSQWTVGKIEEATTTGWGAIGYDADNYFYNQIHSASPGNRWKLNDPQMDKWAEAQQIELDPAKRRAILRQIWDYELEAMYRPALATGFTYAVMQPWTRGLRHNSTVGSHFNYDGGSMIDAVWLDK